jgi:hypothetical protein
MFFKGKAIMKQTLGLVCITLTLSLSFFGQAMAKNFWIKSEVTGCQIWSDKAAQENDSISWSGQCDSDNKASGHGLAVWVRGEELFARYSGILVGGKLHDTNGLLLMKSDSGEGMDVAYGSFDQGEFDGAVTIVGADGSLFQGNYSQGKKKGRGMLVDKSGNSFDGMFDNDLANGLGWSITASGDEYFGSFKDSNREGNGTLFTHDGHIYVGSFKDDQISGDGRFEGSTGYFQGSFSENTPNGAGKIVAEDGTIIQGRFIAGIPDGIVLVTKPDGTQTTKTWKDGKEFNE